MAITVKEIFNFLDTKAPFCYQEGFDNAGFLVGRGDTEVQKILVSLDITKEVTEEAGCWGADLIVSHHPVIFHPVKSITDETTTGRILIRLLECGIAAICAHTNLDAVAEGVNDALAHALGLTEVGQLHQSGIDEAGKPYGIGRIGIVKEQSLTAFSAHVKQAIYTGGVRIVDGGKPVRRVAVGGGACGDMIEDALSHGCDTFVTSDVKYNGFLEAKARGLNLIDAGHFSTENVVCPVLENWLKERFPTIEVRRSIVHKEVFSYL